MVGGTDAGAGEQRGAEEVGGQLAGVAKCCRTRGAGWDSQEEDKSLAEVCADTAPLYPFYLCAVQETAWPFDTLNCLTEGSSLREGRHRYPGAADH